MMRALRVSYDRSVQALYVSLSDKPYDHGLDLDEDRRVDYAADGTPIGVEFLDVDHGVKLDELPEHDAIAKALEPYGLKVYA
jgi:uncharacterized protein YuzE